MRSRGKRQKSSVRRSSGSTASSNDLPSNNTVSSFALNSILAKWLATDSSPQQTTATTKDSQASLLVDRMRILAYALWAFSGNIWRSSSRLCLSPFFMPFSLAADFMHPRSRQLLILDIDETLVHSSTQSQLVRLVSDDTGRQQHAAAAASVRHSRRNGSSRNVRQDGNSSSSRIYRQQDGNQQTIRFRPDFKLEVAEAIDQHTCLYYVYKRPFVDQFLATVNQWFDLAVFTASMDTYADPLIDRLATQAGIKVPLERRFYRQHCQRNSTIQQQQQRQQRSENAIQSVQHEQMFIKDLRTVVNQWCRHYDNDGDDDVLQRVIMIDNSLLNIQSHPANGLLVDDWTASDPNDQTLLRLLPILDSLRYVRDVRQVLGDSRFGAIC